MMTVASINLFIHKDAFIWVLWLTIFRWIILSLNFEHGYHLHDEQQWYHVLRGLSRAIFTTLTSSFVVMRDRKQQKTYINYWYSDYSIDQQMIHYIGMHSFWILVSLHFDTNAGAKAIGGTPRKDLTVKEWWLIWCWKSYERLGNLTFDNWYASAKFLSLLTALELPTISIARVGKAAIKTVSQIEKGEHGQFSYAFDEGMSLHGSKTLLSPCYPTAHGLLKKLNDFQGKAKKTDSGATTKSHQTLQQWYGGVGLLDTSVATY